MEIGQTFISGESIRARAKELAAEIDKDNAGSDKPLICVCVLRGAAMFYCDVIKHLKSDIRCEFVSVRSYDGMKSCEPVLIQDAEIQKGANVVVVEDIVDTGKTVALMKKRFLSQGANSVKLCSMLARKEGVADYIGFVFDTDTGLIIINRTAIWTACTNSFLNCVVQATQYRLRGFKARRK